VGNIKISSRQYMTKINGTITNKSV